MDPYILDMYDFNAARRWGHAKEETAASAPPRPQSVLPVPVTLSLLLSESMSRHLKRAAFGPATATADRKNSASPSFSSTPFTALRQITHIVASMPAPSSSSSPAASSPPPLLTLAAVVRRHQSHLQKAHVSGLGRLLSFFASKIERARIRHLRQALLTPSSRRDEGELLEHPITTPLAVAEMIASVIAQPPRTSSHAAAANGRGGGAANASSATAVKSALLGKILLLPTIQPIVINPHRQEQQQQQQPSSPPLSPDVVAGTPPSSLLSSPFPFASDTDDDSSGHQDVSEGNDDKEWMGTIRVLADIHRSKQQAFEDALFPAATPTSAGAGGDGETMLEHVAKAMLRESLLGDLWWSSHPNEHPLYWQQQQQRPFTIYEPPTLALSKDYVPTSAVRAEQVSSLWYGRRDGAHSALASASSTSPFFPQKPSSAVQTFSSSLLHHELSSVIETPSATTTGTTPTHAVSSQGPSARYYFERLPMMATLLLHDESDERESASTTTKAKPEPKQKEEKVLVSERRTHLLYSTPSTHFWPLPPPLTAASLAGSPMAAVLLGPHRELPKATVDAVDTFLKTAVPSSSSTSSSSAYSSSLSARDNRPASSASVAEPSVVQLLQEHTLAAYYSRLLDRPYLYALQTYSSETLSVDLPTTGVTFLMLRNNISVVLDQMDHVRSLRNKFLCLNDDIDHSPLQTLAAAAASESGGKGEGEEASALSVWLLGASPDDEASTPTPTSAAATSTTTTRAAAAAAGDDSSGSSSGYSQREETLLVLRAFRELLEGYFPTPSQFERTDRQPNAFSHLPDGFYRHTGWFGVPFQGQQNQSEQINTKIPKDEERRTREGTIREKDTTAPPPTGSLIAPASAVDRETLLLVLEIPLGASLLAATRRLLEVLVMGCVCAVIFLWCLCVRCSPCCHVGRYGRRVMKAFSPRDRKDQ